jgi:hypothetical protein
MILPGQIFAESSLANSADVAQDILSLVIPILSASGIVGLFWGIYQYREARNDRRKETFFKLTEEFDNSRELFYAKKILDQWAFDYLKQKNESNKSELKITPSGAFSLFSIEWILSINFEDRMKFESDNPEFFVQLSYDDKHEVWLQLRDSFDSLFSFFERLKYLYNNRRITDNELLYFKYYIKNAKDQQHIVHFLNEYEYTWHNVIDKK